mmetsp:Transcript_106971/g.300869  ORF Transcript_106971/g.300869 Transcript_106971/m.300869 type:complete len:212 (-) Transcript_106971:1529-2164(-)
MLGVGVALFRSGAVPAFGLCEIQWQTAEALRVQCSEVACRRRHAIFCGAAEPQGRQIQTLFATRISREISGAQTALRLRVARFRRPLEPSRSRRRTRRPAVWTPEAHAQNIHRIGVLLLVGGAGHPADGLRMVLLEAARAVEVSQPQQALRRAIPSFRSTAPPTHSLFAVGLDPPTSLIQHSEMHLRVGMAELGGASVELGGTPWIAARTI